MKKIITYLKNHWQADFHPEYYASVVVFLALSIALNYRYDIEDSVIDAYYGQNIRILLYGILYAVAYYIPLLLLAFFQPDKKSFLHDRRFWITSLFAIAVLSVDGSFHYHHAWLQTRLPAETWAYGIRLANQLVSLVTVLLPLYLFYRIAAPASHFYGLTLRHFQAKPYGTLLLLMTPLIALASFSPDFLAAYPRYQATGGLSASGLPAWVPVAVYETAYGWDFISVELLFRGLMVIGMAHLLGRSAIVPMVTTYAFLHFGKPLGETLGSIFGGYILGVIAYQSRSIFGGILIHVGVAWLMELAAYAQTKFNS